MCSVCIIDFYVSVNSIKLFLQKNAFMAKFGAGSNKTYISSSSCKCSIFLFDFNRS
jgi:hypothetical protein